MRNYSALLYYREKHYDKIIEFLEARKELRKNERKENSRFIKELFLFYVFVFSFYCSYILYHTLFYYN